VTSSKKENPTFGALAQRSYVINLFVAIEYDLNMEGTRKRRSRRRNVPKKGNRASFSCWPVITTRNMPLAGYQGGS
jgi:hypothetical protein